MPRKERIVCACGGELSRPIPKCCPHCGADIVAVRRRWWPLVLPAVLVVLMFAALAVYLWWMSTSFYP